MNTFADDMRNLINTRIEEDRKRAAGRIKALEDRSIEFMVSEFKRYIENAANEGKCRGPIPISIDNVPSLPKMWQQRVSSELGDMELELISFDEDGYDFHFDLFIDSEGKDVDHEID